MKQTIKNPIQKVSHKLQYRAIGIIFGTYKPINIDNLNKGIIEDNNGFKIDTVVLGKALPLLKKFVDCKKKYFWIVYPRNKNSENIHIQIAGIWDPNNFKNENENAAEKNYDLLKSLNLKDNFFSIRGKLVYVNVPEKEVVVKILIESPRKNAKNKSFKITLKGEIPIEYINSFVSIDSYRKNNTLIVDRYEIMESKS